MTLFGLGLQSDKSVDAYARIGTAAEALGFDVISVFGDLMYQPPLFPLFTLAARTSRVRLGPACLNPYSMQPYELAGQAAALDLASGGRAYLGLARGSWLGDVGIAAQPRPARHIREAADVAARLIGGDARGYEGEIFRLAPGVRLRYATARPRVPLLVGTWGPVTARMAGEIGAEEVKVGGSANPDFAPVMAGWLAEGAKRGGRDTPPGLVFGAVTVVDTDGAAARRLARREVAMYLAVVAEHDPTLEVDPELLARLRARLDAGDDAAAGALVPDDLLDRFAFSGTPAQLVAQVERLVAAGVDRVEFGTPHGFDPLTGIELLGNAVLPAFR